jgi:hypothetical protein
MPSLQSARSHRPAREVPFTVQHIDALQLSCGWDSLVGDWQSENALDKQMTLLAILVGYDGSLHACAI